MTDLDNRLHPATVRVDPWTGRAIPIDDPLVPLVDQLWRLGIRTSCSCEDYEDRTGQSWVAFHDGGDALRFAELLSPEWDCQLGTQCRHMPGAPWRSERGRRLGIWTWGVQPNAPTCHCRRADCRHCHNPDRPVFPWMLSVAVWMPRGDVAGVVETLAGRSADWAPAQDHVVTQRALVRLRERHAAEFAVLLDQETARQVPVV